MNTRAIGILATLAFLIGGCGKSTSTSTVSNGDTQPAPPIQAEPFHGQVYKSLNGKTTLTLVSKDECELLSEGGTIFLCKYTKPNDTLRIVTTALGTSQVFYFRFTDQGLEDNSGNVLLSPPKYTAALEQARAERDRQIRMEQEAEAQKLAEEKRKLSAMEDRKAKFYTWLRSYCEEGAKFDGSYYYNESIPVTLTITEGPSFTGEGGQLTMQFAGTAHWNEKTPIRVSNSRATQNHRFLMSGYVNVGQYNGAKEADPFSVELEISWWNPDFKQYENTGGMKSVLTESKQASGYLKQRVNKI